MNLRHWIYLWLLLAVVQLCPKSTLGDLCVSAISALSIAPRVVNAENTETQRSQRLFKASFKTLLGQGAVVPVVAYANLSSSQARKAIQSMAGMSLPSDAVRVQRVQASSAESAEARAELELVFRVTQHDGLWRLREVRTGPDRWERLDFIAQAVKIELASGACDEPSQFARTVDATALTTKRARCLVAELLGVTLPSDDVRVREVSRFGFSFGSSDESALISVLVQLDFRLGRDRRGWQVVAVKSGRRDWIDIQGVSAGLDQIKRATASNELALIAQALDSYRRERGFYVVSDKESVLIDHLSPKYLVPVIRLDPWSRPYQYDGQQTAYSLRSLGPDGKPDTGDDIVVKKGADNRTNPSGFSNPR